MRTLVRTRRPALDPCLRELAELRLRAGRGITAFVWRPAPRDEIVVRQMLLQLRERAPAIAVLVLDLLADLAHRLAFPRHLERREAPARMARNAFVGRAPDQREVLFGMAGGAR